VTIVALSVGDRALQGAMSVMGQVKNRILAKVRYWRLSDHRHDAGGRRLEPDLLGDI
jgi:hypothetical protein